MSVTKEGHTKKGVLTDEELQQVTGGASGGESQQSKACSTYTDKVTCESVETCIWRMDKHNQIEYCGECKD